jgi:hypothetical protein
MAALSGHGDASALCLTSASKRTLTLCTEYPLVKRVDGLVIVTTAWAVVRGSSCRSAKLAAFLDRRRSALVDIGGKIDKVDTALGLSARLNTHHRLGDIAEECLAQQLFRREVAGFLPAALR